MIGLFINNDLHDLSLRHLYLLTDSRLLFKRKDRRNIDLHSQFFSISKICQEWAKAFVARYS